LKAAKKPVWGHEQQHSTKLAYLVIQTGRGLRIDPEYLSFLLFRLFHELCE